MFEGAIAAGVSLPEFWDASPEELLAVIDIRGQQKKERMRTLASLLYACAALTAIGVNNPKKFPTIGEAFPGLFEEERGVQDWRVMKQRVEDFSRQRGMQGCAE